MDISELTACNKDYTIQSLSYTSIEFGVSGPGLASPVTYTYGPSSYDCDTDKLSHDFGRMPSGVPLTISVTVRNNDEIVAHANSAVTLGANTSTTVPLTCSVDTASSLNVEFNCDALCDPPPPVNLAPYIRGMRSLAADSQGNLYISGEDTPVNSHTWSKDRLIRVYATHQVDSNFVEEYAREISDLHVSVPVNNPQITHETLLADLSWGDDRVLAPSPNRIKAFDISASTVISEGYINSHRSENVSYSYTFTLNKAGETVTARARGGTGPTRYIFEFFKNGSTATTTPITLYERTWLEPDNITLSRFRPHRLVWDGDADQPIFTCPNGIATVDIDANTDPQTLFSHPLGNVGVGLASTGENSLDYLVTWQNEQQVHFWTKGSTSSSVAFDFNNFAGATKQYYPKEIERGADGYYYAMVVYDAIKNAPNWYNKIYLDYKIVKLRLNGNILEYVSTPVSTP